MRIKTTVASLLIASSPLAAPAFTQSTNQPFRVLAEQDLIPNLGQLSLFVQVVLNDEGSFVAEAQAAGTPGRSVLRDGFLTFTQGIPIPEPPGWSVGTNTPFQSIAINAATNIGWILRVEDLAAGTNAEGLYINADLLHLEGEPLLASVVDPEGLVTENYVYDAFDYGYLNDANQYIYRGRIDPPAGGNAETVLIRIDTDGEGGIIGEEIVLRTNITVDGKTIRALPNRANTLAMNNRGDWITAVAVNGATRTTDTRVIINGEVVIREGQFFTPLGIDYDNLLDIRASINDFGDWAMLAPLSSSRIDTILLNAAIVVAQEGAPMNSIAPDTVAGFGPVNGPRIKLTNSGDVFWFADLTGSNNRNSAFFRNQDLIIRQGDTLPEGNSVISIRKTERIFDASPNGRWWIGEVNLAPNSLRVLFMADYGLALPVPGSGVNLGTLKKLRGDAQVGQFITFELGNPQGDGVLPFLIFSAAPAIPGSPFGIMTKLGEVLINPNPASILGTFQAAPIAGDPANISFMIPPDVSLVEFEAWGQGLFIDANGTAPGEKIRLTNGFTLVLGAP